MMWADSVPNLLIGLREGLEAGLVVSILLAAVRKMSPEARRGMSTAPVWLGVLGAVMLASGFAAVLTFSASALSSRGQEAVGGLLSVLAVGLVTGMVPRDQGHRQAHPRQHAAPLENGASRSSTMSSRSAEVTSSPFPASGTPPTGTAARCSPDRSGGWPPAAGPARIQLNMASPM